MRGRVILLCAGSIIVLVVAFIAASGLLIADDDPRVVPVADGIVGLRSGYAWVYILRQGEEVVLVDAGNDPEGNTILTELARSGHGPSSVVAILITHAHRDHVQAVPVFPNATVYLSRQTQRMWHGEITPQGLLPKLAERFTGPSPPPERARVVLPGGRLTAGGRVFDVVAVPGHTPGSTMFLHGDLLFTGDSLLRDGDGVDAGPWVFSDSRAQNERSLGRLESLRFRGIADGHHGYTPDGRQRFEAWLDKPSIAALRRGAP